MQIIGYWLVGKLECQEETIQTWVPDHAGIEPATFLRKNKMVRIAFLAFGILILAFGWNMVLCFHPLQYYFINKDFNWSDASVYCKENYHGLAIVNSLDRNNMLKEFPGQVWIGLSDREDSWKGVMGQDRNSWRWSTNDTVTPDGFQNWTTGQPDNEKSNQLCVTMTNGQWTDDFCGLVFPFICYTASLCL
ncbi:hypothetical protein WMY93_015208 [Mugilogobius chulae]|uniref:C-type lectin domain-containing protein n=1 Tax=Mugilogobius chulae TaxID=88201 RepID=A0AAW0NXI3_9GOBI